jgi:MipA family protein
MRASRTFIVLSLYICCLIGFLSVCEKSWADDDILYPLRPKWELGANLGAFYLPDYPGSNNSQLRFLPLPYIVYRGEFFKSDQTGGVRGSFIDNEYFDFDISADTAFPVDSSSNTARAGMPSLDWMFEIGPRALVHVYHQQNNRVDLGFAMRAIYSISLSELDTRGYDFISTLRYRRRLPTPRPSYFSLIWGGTWATDNLMAYFYQVDPQYVTGSRPAYEAKPGFLGENISAFYVQPFANDWSFYAGAAQNFYSEAANRSSPLVQTVEAQTFYIGIYWSSFKSEKEVTVADDD